MKETSIRRIDLVVKATAGLAIAAILASPMAKFSHPQTSGQGEAIPAPAVPVPDPGHRVLVDPSVPDTMKRVNEAELLAETILLEAVGEGRKGMIAVANVIINRIHDPRWPDTVAAVVKQPRQFSCWNDERAAYQRLARMPKNLRDMARQIAEDALNGDLPVMTRATHYHATSVKPAWASKSAFLGRIGRHDFYRL